jgi:K+-transporting ATPase KdpF subunit
MSALARASRGGPAMSEPVIGFIVAVLLGCYLVFALLHPEKF